MPRLLVPLLAAAVVFAGASSADVGQSQILIRTSTMLGPGIPSEDIQKLSVAVSQDGVNWTRLFKKPTLTNFSRDASVIRYENEYITVYTDAFNSSTGTLGLARSTDLVHWTATNVTLTGPAMTNTPNNTWAPEWFVDAGRYYILVRSTQQTAEPFAFPNYAPPGIGYLECLDPGTWTNWTDFMLLEDLEPTYENDPFIIKVGEIYHLFTDHFNYPGGPAILHRKSTEGPFSGYGPPVNIATNFANAHAYVSSGLNQSSPWEGQFVLPLGGDRYRLYFQAMWHDASFCIESLDGMESWDTGTMQWLTYDGLPAYGHGSVLPIPNDDFLVPAITAAKLPASSLSEAQSLLSVYTDTVEQSSRREGRADVMADPSSYGLYTATQYTDNRAAGRADVLADPAGYELFTSNSIMDLNLGGVMIERQGDTVQLSLQIQSTTNLATPFTNHGPPLQLPPLENIPADKAFFRLYAPNPQ